MRNVPHWAVGCSVFIIFMIGYFLVLTLFLPSIFIYKPDWLEVGSYAEYTVEEYLSTGPLEKGTYAWTVISIYTDAHGEVMARINETYTPMWQKVYTGQRVYTSWLAKNIPSTGRILDINVKDGVIGSKPFWFNRYYNHYLLDLSRFKIGDETFEGVRLEEISVQGETRPCVKLTKHLRTYYRPFIYYFDGETGLLLKYAFGFKDVWDRMLLKSTNISSETHNGKAMMDLLLVSPLFIVPVVGAATGLLDLFRHSR